MIAELTNHLWQSTLFAVAAALLTLVFRKNRAQVRYWLWFSASVKLLFPFALLMSLGSLLDRPPAPSSAATRVVSGTVLQIAEPFPASVPARPSKHPARDWASIAILGIWACGFAAVGLIRFRGWIRIEAALRASAPVEIPAAVEIRSAPGLLEPGVVGWLRPVLLLPEGIAQRLTPRQLEAVLAHELCHVRRRDNLTSGIHMIVEALFWFYPLVWWMGARLVEERELACDEEVLRQGGEPQIYAEAILNVCRHYLESPLACVSGISGSDLKKRIQAILAERVAGDLNFAKKVALAAAGVTALAAPIALGILNAPIIRAQSAAAGTPNFEVASIRLCTGSEGGGRGKGRGGGGDGSGPSLERLNTVCQPLMNYIRMAYVNFADGHFAFLRPSVPIEGGPGWINSARYRIDAKAENPVGQSAMRGPMLQALLEDRFKLKVHRETREVPVFELTVTKGGAKFKASEEGSCIAFDLDHRPPPSLADAHFCGMVEFKQEGMTTYGATMADFAQTLSNELDRPVIDKTGLTGKFDIHLDVTSADLGIRGRGQTDMPASRPVDPLAALLAALRPVGLKLDAAKGPHDFLVIDHVERPSDN